MLCGDAADTLNWASESVIPEGTFCACTCAAPEKELTGVRVTWTVLPVPACRVSELGETAKVKSGRLDPPGPDCPPPQADITETRAAIEIKRGKFQVFLRTDHPCETESRSFTREKSRL